MTINIIPVNPTVDTFSSWVERTNEVINAIAIHTITSTINIVYGSEFLNLFITALNAGVTRSESPILPEI